MQALQNLDPQPESIPINQLVAVKGTPLEQAEKLDWTEFVRTIAVARITMPKSYVRLSAGRQGMSEEMQAMCFMAGANYIFYGEKLLTTENPEQDLDQELMFKLNLEPEISQKKYIKQVFLLRACSPPPDFYRIRHLNFVLYSYECYYCRQWSKFKRNRLFSYSRKCRSLSLQSILF